MTYKTIHFFTDLQDFNHPYNVGDVFPRSGLVVSDARLKELSSKDNKQGKPLIELVKNNVVDTVEEKYTKTEINRMPTADLQALATTQGVEDAESYTGAELKKILIDKFGL